ncbi:hypothetical protein MED297_16554 [Reinekea blandensis MED297]|uniref:Uncharacterized protein n=1 Tax=Reinekea blandensis MED297 TaxID=314283 RepID=A4BHH1_9GAMM|nr:hypothetical protein MED297_16554 [Reinekea blandensis MED297]
MALIRQATEGTPLWKRNSTSSLSINAFSASKNT